VPEAFGAAPVRDSAAIPHRAGDAYHGSYNDYLWQLALADGEAPDVLPSVASKSDELDHRSLVDGLTPRPIQLDPPSPDDPGR
ncbi:MAG TPA: hypothetical protein VKB75_17350, partial [Jatrophihabitans sp.]|nr:hypothetical protein [Jatrophihabitans sp.]